MLRGNRPLSCYTLTCFVQWVTLGYLGLRKQGPTYCGYAALNVHPERQKFCVIATPQSTFECRIGRRFVTPRFHRMFWMLRVTASTFAILHLMRWSKVPEFALTIFFHTISSLASAIEKEASFGKKSQVRCIDNRLGNSTIVPPPMGA